MFGRDYRFFTKWQVTGNVEEVAEIFEDAPGLARWWPSVYLRVDMLEPGGSDGVGAVFDLYTKGWLPYTLSWKVRVIENRHPFGYTMEAMGDFIGKAILVFAQDGPEVGITLDWQLEVGKSLLRRYSWLLRPVFEANHRWAMRQGEKSLRLELARRRANTDAERHSVPPPPGPTFKPRKSSQDKY